MTTLQEWLNQKYPTKAEKSEVKIIGLGIGTEWKNLDGGELDLSEFTGLERVCIMGDSLKTPLKKTSELTTSPQWLKVKKNFLQKI